MIMKKLYDIFIVHCLVNIKKLIKINVIFVKAESNELLN